MMLNGSGFNVGCFCFPVVQAFLGHGRDRARRHVRHWQLRNGCRRYECDDANAAAHQAWLPLTEQYQGSAPTLPYVKPKDKDAKRLARKALARNVFKGFFGSVPFDTYLVMIILTLANVKIPDIIAAARAAAFEREFVLRNADGGHAYGFAIWQAGCASVVEGDWLATAVWYCVCYCGLAAAAVWR